MNTATATDNHLDKYTTGAMAYIDSFCGLIKCKVTEVREPGDGRSCTNGEIAVVVTKARQAYHLGEKLVLASCLVIPRDKVRLKRGGHFTINTMYEWVCP